MPNIPPRSEGLALSILAAMAGYDRFEFYQTGSTAMSAVLGPGLDFFLADVRLHLASVGSALDLILILSAARGGISTAHVSAYDLKVLSQAISQADTLIQLSPPLLFKAGDTITFNYAQGSSANIWGVMADGWTL